MQKRKILTLIILIIVMLFAGLYFAYANGLIFKKDKEQEDNNIYQNNIQITNEEEEKIVYIDGTREVNGIELSNIKITLIEEDKCEFTADVKNKTEEYKKATNLRIKTKDENGEIKEIFGGWITDLIPKEENTFKTYILKDILDAKDVEFEEIE